MKGNKGRGWFFLVESVADLGNGSIMVNANLLHYMQQMVTMTIK
jgi:hypothetical protein